MDKKISEKIKKGLKKDGFYIARGLIKKDLYDKARIESIKYFQKNFKNNLLDDALRGSVSAGMRNIEGFSETKNWKIYRSCFFLGTENLMK